LHLAIPERSPRVARRPAHHVFLERLDHKGRGRAKVHEQLDDDDLHRLEWHR